MAAKKPPQPNPCIEAIAAMHDITIAGLSNSERSRINRALNQLQTACPDPTARELIRRPEAYRHNSGRPLLPPPPAPDAPSPAAATLAAALTIQRLIWLSTGGVVARVQPKFRKNSNLKVANIG